MAYTALTLINKAYYLSQVVSRDLQQVSGSQQSDGLDLLNALLEIKSSDLRLIPYFQEYDFNTVQGQEEYFVPGLLEVQTMTFNIGPVRFNMSQKFREQYRGEGRVDNTQSLPFTWNVERCLGGANVSLYFVPQQIFPMKIWGKFALTNVTLQTDLSLIYDGYYIEYLRYALAEYICSDWAINFPEQAAMKYKEIRKKLTDVAPFDLTMKKLSTLSKNQTMNWALTNIPGYLPT